MPAEAKTDPTGIPDEPFKPLDLLSTDVRMSPGDMPRRPSVEQFAGPVHVGTFAGRGWRHSLAPWEASALCHRPLYFEEVALERYGHSLGAVVQPVLSAAHFFGTLPALPYKMTLEPPRECVFALGYYRPGSAAPHLRYRIPFRVDAALVEAAAATGVVFILP